MSFVPASSSRDLWAVLAVVAVAALALVARMKSKSGDGGAGAPPGTAEGAGVGPTAPELDADDADDADHEDHDARAGPPGRGTIPVTAEGVAFVSSGQEMRLLPLVDRDAEPEAIPGWVQSAIEAGAAPHLDQAQRERWVTDAVGARPGTPLSPGDFTAARIRPGVAGVYASRLETLGRDGDFGFFPFVTESGARAALDLLERHAIVASALDESGQPVPPSPEDFEEARRRYEETERALALDSEDDPPGDERWTSDRR